MHRNLKCMDLKRIDVHNNKQIILINTGVRHCKTVLCITRNHSKLNKMWPLVLDFLCVLWHFLNSFPGHLNRIWPNRQWKSNRKPDVEEHMDNQAKRKWREKAREGERERGKEWERGWEKGLHPMTMTHPILTKKSATVIKKIPFWTMLTDEQISIYCIVNSYTLSFIVQSLEWTESSWSWTLLMYIWWKHKCANKWSVNTRNCRNGH